MYLLSKTYNKICKNPNCKKPFTTKFNRQIYCSPSCRLSSNKKYNYHYSRVNKAFISPPLDQPVISRRYTCSKCNSKMKLKYTSKGHKLYLECTKKKCINKVDFDRYLNEGRAENKVKLECID